jgi:hypothetical protein
MQGARAAAGSAFGEVHASLACLLGGTSAGDGEQRSRLCGSAAALERMRAADAVFVQSMAQLLRALRLLSCC